MSIATQTGDTGETSLAGGGRVSEGDARVEAYGAIDELIALIGMSRALAAHDGAAALARTTQRDLFAVAETLASDEEPPAGIDPARVRGITGHVHRIEHQDGILIERDAGVDASLRRAEDGGTRWSRAWP